MSRSFILRYGEGGEITVRHGCCKCNACFKQDVNEGYMEYCGMYACLEHIGTPFWKPIFHLNVAAIRTISGRIVNDPVAEADRQ